MSDKSLNIAIVGAGLSGAVVGRLLAEAGHTITVFDSRNHLGGNCHTARDADTGILIHCYGPHIFHTDDEQVWDFVNRFAKFHPYQHNVYSTIGDEIYSMPINLHTINQFFKRSFNPQQAQEFISGLADKTLSDPQNFEDQALSMIGADLYHAFFKGYTEKQWGCSPRDLPAAILKRLPVRFNYNSNYFNHQFQGMPISGYTDMVAGIFDVAGIERRLSSHVDSAALQGYDHVFFSGALDGFFDYNLGDLGYRTLDFKEHRQAGDYIGCPVMNYGDADVAFTRITEHKHFAPWENHTDTVVFYEYSRAAGRNDIPFYPIRLVEEKALLSRYVAQARQVENITFLGRLGTYRYLDMDVTIREAMDTAACFLKCLSDKKTIPCFTLDPL